VSVTVTITSTGPKRNKKIAIPESRLTLGDNYIKEWESLRLHKAWNTVCLYNDCESMHDINYKDIMS